MAGLKSFKGALSQLYGALLTQACAPAAAPCLACLLVRIGSAASSLAPAACSRCGAAAQASSARR